MLYVPINIVYFNKAENSCLDVSINESTNSRRGDKRINDYLTRCLSIRLRRVRRMLNVKETMSTRATFAEFAVVHRTN